MGRVSLCGNQRMNPETGAEPTNVGYPIGGSSIPPPRKRLRGLSIRMLMLVVLIVGGWLGWLCYRARVQGEALAAIERAGGKIWFDWQWKNGRFQAAGKPGWLRRQLGPGFFEEPKFVAVESTAGAPVASQINDGLMLQIGRLRNLQTLRVVSASVTDAGLAQVRNLRDLRELTFQSSKVTSLGPANLGGLTRLESLSFQCMFVRKLDLGFLRGLSSLRDLRISGSRQKVQLDLTPLEGLPQLQKLSLGFILTDADLAHLKGLRNLTSLGLNGQGITNSGLQYLRSLRALKELRLFNVTVTDLQPLSLLASLESLGLWRTQVDDAGLAPIQNLRALKELVLRESQITDAGMSYLRGLKTLTMLELPGARITDKGLESLGGLSKLEGLSLDHTAITDSGLASIAGLPNLQVLSLQNTAITDAGLTQLAGLRRCRAIRVAGTNVTPAGIAALKAKCPLMKIVR
jgi:internalin A